MSQMSRAQRMLLVYILVKLSKPRVIQEINKFYGAGGGISQIQEASDVDTGAIGNNKILVYKTTSSKHEYEDKYADSDAVAAVEAEANLTLGTLLPKTASETLGDTTHKWNQADITSVLVWSNLDLKNCSTPIIYFDYGVGPGLEDSLEYDKATNIFTWNIGSTARAKLDATSFKCDQFDEVTIAHGCNVDGVLCKDSVIPDTAYPNAVLKDGSRAMTGDLDMGDHDIDLGTAGAGKWRRIYANDVQLKIHPTGLYIYLRNRADDDYATFIGDVAYYHQFLALDLHGNAYFDTQNAADCVWNFRAYDGASKQTCAILSNGEMSFPRAGDITMLDQKMMTLGTYTDAQRPAAGTAGRVIFNTDDGMPNYDDGTNWRDVNGNIT